MCDKYNFFVCKLTPEAKTYLARLLLLNTLSRKG
jgi:hypothetical protein